MTAERPRPSLGQAALRGLTLGAWLTAWLTLCLSALRLIQLWHYWPADASGLWQELPTALWWGARFDAKVSATAALLLWPLLCWQRSARLTVRVWTAVWVLLGLINFYYYGFYKTPIDSVVFGVIDDDTQAIFHTIWLDFPLAQMAFFLVAALGVGVGGAGRVVRWWQARIAPPVAWWWALPLLLVGLLVVAKGTLKGMALQPNHLSATTQPFLNDAVPNGVTALHNAWFAYSESTHLDRADTGLRRLGFDSAVQAAQALGWSARTEQDVAQQLLATGRNQPTGQHLVFFQMESWSAEPMRYQGPGMDVLGRLQAQLPHGTLFTNFDSAHVGTHPSLEAILLGSPVTPISTGRYRDVVYPWGLAQVFKRAGYDTLFVTPGESGWRELNRVLLTQGFDEFIDAAKLRLRYPDAQGGIWGLWDGYMTRYIEERLRAQPPGRPLFIYAMTTTHHPPYEVPQEARRVSFDMGQWGGDKSNESLEASLRSYRYANEVLADFVAHVRGGPLAPRTLIAATGDHIMRTVGQYNEPARRIWRQQVPFVVWGAPALACPQQRQAPASHLDMFPTLFPLLGIHAGYLRTGRNLWACTPPPEDAALAVTFVDQVRAHDSLWQPGRADSLLCTPPQADCQWSATRDAQARARVALLDWNIRHHVLRATAKIAP